MRNVYTNTKVIERIVADQIKVYLAENDLMPSVQSAYRQGHSTETAVLKLISDIIDAAKFHENRVRIATVGEVTDRETDRRR